MCMGKGVNHIKNTQKCVWIMGYGYKLYKRMAT